MPERLQKIISRFGVASRRQAEELILSGQVFVNGQSAQLGDQVDPTQDEIKVAGKVLKPAQQSNLVYYLLNKPAGYVCTTRTFQSEKKVIDLVPKKPIVWPVGRLDKNSTGLIILTNDGDLTQKLTHPKFEHVKKYQVQVNKKVTSDFLKKMKQGIKLQEGLARADQIKQIGENQFKIVLHQGWQRQIRRMCETLGYQVLSLHRTQIANIKLGNLKPGEFRKTKKPF